MKAAIGKVFSFWQPYARLLSKSFIHCTYVGHFDPTTLFPDRPLRALRPIDRHVVECLLAEYSPGVRGCVEYVDGYVVVEWSACPFGRAYEFGYRLAELAHCIAAESPVYQIVYPEQPPAP